MEWQYFGCLLSPENLPNVALVIVGIAGIITAVFTLRVIGEQTTASKKSVLLQETAMQQWVNIKNWTKNYRSAPDGSAGLGISFELVNPTNWPLTIVNTKLRINPIESWAVHNILLAPNSPYAVRVNEISLSKEQENDYLNARIVLVVFGMVTFRDCFERVREQEFSGLLQCGKTATTFTLEWLPNNPFRAKQGDKVSEPTSSEIADTVRRQTREENTQNPAVTMTIGKALERLNNKLSLLAAAAAIAAAVAPDKVFPFAYRHWFLACIYLVFGVAPIQELFHPIETLKEMQTDRLGFVWIVKFALLWVLVSIGATALIQRVSR
jgi:hypothetical protein